MDLKMSNMFESIKQGLTEALDLVKIIVKRLLFINSTL